MGRFVPNLRGIAEIAVLPGMVNEMGNAADGLVEEIVRQWEATDHPYETGEFVASIQADGGIEGASAVGRASSDAEYAPYIEFGTEDTPEFQPFRLGLDAFHL